METHDEAGVDLTLIDWMLALTPDERLAFHDQMLRSVLELRAAAGLSPEDDG